MKKIGKKKSGKGGRPKLPDDLRRSESLGDVRVSPLEKRLIRKAARSCGTNYNEFCRARLLTGLVE